ncbi:hypothetical protein LX64_03414 [Chitinophaga skermanii]|uniref:DUF4136 domain-containing protein n=1 Tax=Chitinophaga skermanii TaxID=331697 RepID=A0A327QDL3_9BACT|nr:hypothetical protein [Chitinophaga skermanii]RAJ02401.1 hypothetical protein LX64_03414 [Chitinophaga skermanii]
MRQPIFIGLFIVLSILCYACATTNTKIVSSWRNPSIRLQRSDINKFVVAVFLKDDSTRKMAENLIARRFPGQAVPSYEYLGFDRLSADTSFYLRKAAADGKDGVVVVYLSNVDRTRNIRAKNIQYSQSWSTGINQAIYAQDVVLTVRDQAIYQVQVDVYAANRNALIWSGLTSTVDPFNDKTLIHDVTTEVVRQMKKERFLQ